MLRQGAAAVQAHWQALEVLLRPMPASCVPGEIDESGPEFRDITKHPLSS
jgi:hypothetical protein